MRISGFRLPIWSPRLLWKLTGAYLLITIVTASVFVLIDVELDYRRILAGGETTGTRCNWIPRPGRAQDRSNGSVALSGLEEFWAPKSRWFLHRLIS